MVMKGVELLENSADTEKFRPEKHELVDPLRILEVDV